MGRRPGDLSRWFRVEFGGGFAGIDIRLVWFVLERICGPFLGIFAMTGTGFYLFGGVLQIELVDVVAEQVWYFAVVLKKDAGIARAMARWFC